MDGRKVGGNEMDGGKERKMCNREIKNHRPLGRGDMGRNGCLSVVR